MTKYWSGQPARGAEGLPGDDRGQPESTWLFVSGISIVTISMTNQLLLLRIIISITIINITIVIVIIMITT